MAQSQHATSPKVPAFVLSLWICSVRTSNKGDSTLKKRFRAQADGEATQTTGDY